jgi:hypothetical protein
MAIPFQLITYDQAQRAFERKRLPKVFPQVRAFTIRVENKLAL